MFLALAILYPNDRLSGFAMATCRAAKLYQRPLNSMRSLFKVSIFGDKILVPKKVQIYNI